MIAEAARSLAEASTPRVPSARGSQAVRDEEQRLLLESAVFVRWLLESDVSHLRAVQTRQGLSDTEMEAEAQCALAMGYNTALMFRFLESHGLTHWVEEDGWWDESWLKHMRGTEFFRETNRKHRQYDYQNVRRFFPEIDEFYPHERPLEIEEILRTARKELYDLLCGPGSDYKEDRLIHNYDDRTRKAAPKAGDTHRRTPLSDLHHQYHLAHNGSRRNAQVIWYRGEGDDDEGGEEFIDPHLLHAEGLDLYRGEGCSPEAILIGVDLVERYGPRPAAYWLWDKMFFRKRVEDKGRFADLLRFMGGENAPPGESTLFNTQKRDVNRKIEIIDHQIIVFQRMPEILCAYERVG